MFDFHTHTVISDGYDTPEQVIGMAAEYGLSAVAITDHNEILEEYPELREKYRGRIRLFNGAELSSVYHYGDGQRVEVHIIALNFDSELLRETVDRISFDRETYLMKIREKLSEWDIAIPDYETLRVLYPEHKHIGRTQIADYMVEHGYASDVDEAMDEYIGTYGHRKAYVEVLDYANYEPVEEIVRAVIRAGGIPVLAHLFSYRLSDEESRRLVADFQQAADGAPAGIEVYYRKYSEADQGRLMEIAREHGLLVSRASDYHGREGHSLMTRDYPGWNCPEKTVYDALTEAEK